jgi:ankyrin repeat protein
MLSNGRKHGRSDDDLVETDAGDLSHWGGIVNVLQNHTVDGLDESTWDPRARKAAEIFRRLDRSRTENELKCELWVLRYTEADRDWLASPLLDGLFKWYGSGQTELNSRMGELYNASTACYLFDRGTRFNVDTLIDACASGNLAVATWLLDNGVRANAYSCQRRFLCTAIEAAIENNQTEIVRLLLQRGAKMDLISKEEVLVRAIRRNYFTMAKILILEVGLHLSEPIIVAAAMVGSVSLLKIILKSGGKVNDKALNEAAANGHIEAMRFLLGLGCDPTYYYQWGYSLSAAASNGHLKAVAFLIDHGVNVNLHSGVCLLKAVAANRADVVELLLRHGADPLLCHESLLAIAATYGYLEVMKLLCESKQLFVCTFAIDEAIRANRLDALQMLLNFSTSSDHAQSLEQAIERQIPRAINTRKSLQGTSYLQHTLLSAVSERNTAAIDMAIARGCDVNHNEGEALKIAMRLSSVEVTKLLLANGVHVEHVRNQLPDDDEITPLLRERLGL